ncbi:Hypothetical protein SCF082_LOCUS16240 [Durusdinium trenchii]|uniref:WW domain-containing protein n=1 Tax=Durusdinium trenchii TaxID=1381693 RepID=A0ABP0KAE1_9DINO
MSRVLEWDVDSLALSELSDEAEKQDLQFDPDLAEYGRSLGIPPEHQEDSNITWVLHQAYHAPLPAGWTEHLHQGRVYFYHDATGVTSWNHPWDHVYKELIQLIKDNSPKDHEQRAQAVRDHLFEVHDRCVAELGCWSGPFRTEEGDTYYFNEGTQVSTWANPQEDCEYEISIRQVVLHRCLLGQKQEHIEVVPTLNLPGLGDTEGLGGLAREKGEGPDTDDPISARSFYTARESARDSARSRSKGSESPPRIRSKGQPARALVDLAVDRVTDDQNLDDTRTTATSKVSPDSPKTQDPETQAGQQLVRDESMGDEMDLTFGCPIAMPMIDEARSATDTDRGDGKSEQLAHDEHITDASSFDLPFEQIKEPLSG